MAFNDRFRTPSKIILSQIFQSQRYDQKQITDPCHFACADGRSGLCSHGQRDSPGSHISRGPQVQTDSRQPHHEKRPHEDGCGIHEGQHLHERQAVCKNHRSQKGHRTGRTQRVRPGSEEPDKRLFNNKS